MDELEEEWPLLEDRQGQGATGWSIRLGEGRSFDTGHKHRSI